MARVRITMSNDAWDPILLPEDEPSGYGDPYEVDREALDRFVKAREEFWAAFTLLHQSAVRVNVRRHGARR